MKTTTTRETMTAPEFLTMNDGERAALIAAAVENAMKRREADSGRDLLQMRVKYQEDARQEAFLTAWERASGDWIDGTTKDGTPRRYLPLAYFAAMCAGRALDRLMYADGGRAVKLSGRERRAYYADREDAPAAVVETRRAVDPIAPAPESALIESEQIERVLSEVKPALRENAARLARAVYMGAESVREAGRECGLPEATARRAWAAVRNAAAAVLEEDGETRALERMIESDRRTRENMSRRRASAAVKEDAARLASAPMPAPGAVDWTARRPAARLASTARLTPSDVRDLAALFYSNRAGA